MIEEYQLEEMLKKVSNQVTDASEQLKQILADQSLNPDQKFDKMVAILSTLEVLNK
jgi:hypothetical protein